MPVFDRGTVVRVPFPYTDRPVSQRRPALVVSAISLGDSVPLLWVVMITSADNRRWPGDIDLTQNYAAVGLPAASLIRLAKIATIQADHADPLGMVGAGILDQVDAGLRRQLGF